MRLIFLLFLLCYYQPWIAVFIAMELVLLARLKYLYLFRFLLGSIFVRIYNSDPSFQLENPGAFVDELLGFLSNNDPNASLTLPQEVGKIIQCVEALSNVMKNNSGLESHFKGKFRLLTRYLMCPFYEKGVLSLLTSLMSNQECVGEIVGMGIVPGLLVLSASAQKDATVVIIASLSCLSMIVTHSQVAKEVIQKGTLDSNLRKKSKYAKCRKHAQMRYLLILLRF